MKHPISIALFSLAGILGIMLICLFIFRPWNGAVIPKDWTTNGDENVPPIVPGNGGDAVVVPTEIVSTSGNIAVSSPAANATIGLPLVFVGKARVFESVFNYRLLDTNGDELVTGHAMSNAPDMGEFGYFTVTTSYNKPNGTTGTLEVFAYSAKDGSVIDLVSVPVVFPVVESMVVKTYWLESGETDCDTVVATKRRVPKTVATAHAALTELLSGPGGTESAQNLTTSIPSGVTITSLSITDGVATVVFSSGLETGGSCRVTSIRAQIEATLKQFSTVTSVVISTAGKTPEESLQP